MAPGKAYNKGPARHYRAARPTAKSIRTNPPPFDDRRHQDGLSWDGLPMQRPSLCAALRSRSPPKHGITRLFPSFFHRVGRVLRKADQIGEQAVGAGHAKR
jgi:hypothetical protein